MCITNLRKNHLTEKTETPKTQKLLKKVIINFYGNKNRTNNNST